MLLENEGGRVIRLAAGLYATPEEFRDAMSLSDGERRARQREIAVLLVNGVPRDRDRALLREYAILHEVWALRALRLSLEEER